MASFNIVLCVVLFAAVALGNTISNTRREHFIDECINPPDGYEWTHFQTYTVEASGKLLQIVTKEFKWPQNGQASGKIKCIRVTDLQADGTGGYPTIRDGGVDYTHVTLHFESQRSHGLLFRVEILGEPAIKIEK